MKDVYILGIETSCDETSFSIIKNGVTDIATVISTQIKIHEDYGGVVPEIASREHLKNITLVLDQVLREANMKMEDLDAIAVTYAPGLVGSLLIGVQAAKTLSYIYDLPLIAVNHMVGHIYSNQLVKDFEFPALILVVSGGHTQIVLMEDHLKFKLLGETLDDAVGETYDKVARIVGLSYPGGPKLDKLSKYGKDIYEFPIPLDDDSLNFSFSGLKTAVLNFVNKERMRQSKFNVEDLAKSFQETVKEIFRKKLTIALDNYEVKSLIVAGGVAANSGVREVVKEIADKYDISYSFPPMKYCTDNAAMIGAAAYQYYLNNDFSNLELSVKSQEEI